MTSKDESMSAAEIAHIARVLLGPEENWDEADSEFVMKLFGVEPELSTKEMFDLVLGMVKKFNQEREEVPPSLTNMLTKLASKLKREDPRVEAMVPELKERFSQKESKGLAVAASNRFRGKRELSERDEEILQELSAELLSEAGKENQS